ncbi:MAG: hypothetical protein NTW21_21055 [Verrucomicrobia bacterium]|nr:hypothetical protein [Verrucomicrobiota bacterium]
MKSLKIPSARTGRWTRSEVQQLQRIFGSNSNERLARILRRSVASIQHQARRYQLAKNKVFVKKHRGQGVYKMPRWTPEQVKMLRRIYANLSNLEVARILERSVASVVSQAHVLRLRKSVRHLQGMGRENIRGRWETEGRRNH